MDERESVWDPHDWRKNVIAGRDPFPDGGKVVEESGVLYVYNALGDRVGAVIRDPSDWVRVPDWFGTEDFAFLEGADVEAVTIPGRWDRIAHLRDCRKLEEVSFEGWSREIRLGPDAFAGCSSLKRIELPNGIVMWDCGVFRNCTALEWANIAGVDLFEGVLPAATFENCTALNAVQMPMVWVLGEGCFAGCHAISSILFQQGLKEIMADCFWNCRSLRTIQLPDSVEKIGRHVFGCDNPDPDSGLTAFNIPKGLMEIDPHAFGPGALNFENFTCSEGNGVFKVVDGILYERDDEGGGETLIRCPQGRTGEVVIPKGVKFIEDGAFAYCNKLTKITFLDEEIDPGPESAYEGCSDKLEKNW